MKHTLCCQFTTLLERVELKHVQQTQVKQFACRRHKLQCSSGHICAAWPLRLAGHCVLAKSTNRREAVKWEDVNGSRKRSLLPLVVVVYNLKADAINQSTNLHFKCAFNKFSTRLHCCCCCWKFCLFLLLFVTHINHNLKALQMQRCKI